MSALRIGWLTTGRGPGSFGALEYVLDAIDGGLAVELGVVFVNRERGQTEATDRLLDLVVERGVPLETLSSARFRKERGGSLAKSGEALPAWREEYDREVAALLGGHGVELGVTFGYMMITTEPLFDAFTLLNDHPALPDGPTGTYEHVIRELMGTRATDSGAMMSVVTEELDRGPVVSLCRFPIRDSASEHLWELYERDAGSDNQALYDEIRVRGVVRERPLVVETLAAIERDELLVPPREPLDLTDAVEARLGHDARAARA